MPIRSRSIANKSFHLLATVSIVLTCLPTPISIPTAQAAEPAVEEAPERTPPGMRLYAIVDPAVVQPGGEAACTVTVVNDDVADVEGLTLHAQLAQDLAPEEGVGRTWEAQVEPLAVGASTAITLPLRMTGRPAQALAFEIELRDDEDEVRATTTAVVGVEAPGEAQVIDPAGGLFAAGNGRVQVDFPADALPMAASVSAQIQAQQVAPRSRAKAHGALLRFSLEAQDTITGSEIARFDRPVDLRGMFP